MKKIALFIAVLAMSVNMMAQTAGTVKHEVQSGETLSSISRDYGVSVSYLLKINPGMKADYIMAGQRINVPANGASQHNTTQQTTATSQNTTTAKPDRVPATRVVTNVVPSTIQQNNLQQFVNQQANKPANSQPDDKQTATPAQPRPKYKATHEVQKKETIYAISRQYGISEAELIEANPQLKKNKLKKGEIIYIPFTKEENDKYAEEQRRKREEEEERKRPKVQKYNAVHAAVILPFSLDAEEMTTESQKMANLYQGFLLAVDSLKQHGYSVDIYTYEEKGAGETMEDILSKPMMKNMQLIIGPVRQEHIAAVSKFAHANGITHVVPLSSDGSIVNERPTTYQVNVQTSSIYSQVYNRFIALHRNDNIIFVGMNDKNDNVSYIVNFKKTLDDNNVIYNRVSVNEFDAIKEMIKTGSRNIIVTSSSSASAFDALCKKLATLNLSDATSIQLFGFPEWQTFEAKYDKEFAKYNCQYFTTFYSNGSSQRTIAFNSKFRQWFNQDQFNSYPHYGELGYDIGAFFVKGIFDHGSAFSENIHNIGYNSLEFPFFFEKKNSWSGYENKSMLIVSHTSDGRIVVR